MTTPALTIEVRAEAVARLLAAVAGRLQGPALLKLIGARHLGWINENFREEGAERPWAPMAANTRAGRRGGGRGARLLRDTGRLAQSFVAEVSGDTVRVGTADRRARWHHEGTAPYVIRPVTAKALRFPTVGGPVFRREVHHPGLPARPLLPSQGLAEALALTVVEAAVAKTIRDAEGSR